MTSPAAPFTELVVATVQQHELFRAWVEAGFTEDQALKLLIGILTATTNPAGGGS